MYIFYRDENDNAALHPLAGGLRIIPSPFSVTIGAADDTVLARITGDNAVEICNAVIERIFANLQMGREHVDLALEVSIARRRFEEKEERRALEGARE